MPEFRPNEYMYKNFADKGAERWEIYSWCVRDAMAKAGGFKLADRQIAEKITYQKLMQCKVDIITIDGKVYQMKEKFELQLSRQTSSTSLDEMRTDMRCDDPYFAQIKPVSAT